MAYKDQIANLLHKAGAEVGDTIEFLSKSKLYRGILMPHHQFSGNEIIVIKLKSGYNIGMQIDPNTDVTLVAKKEKTETGKAGIIGVDKNKPTISILHTGGTIASRVDYRTGAVSTTYRPEDIVAMFPEIRDKANILSRLISNIWSEDLRFSHYNLMANEIKKDIDSGIDGIILTHGTDTLAYTAAALSFILENLPIPVILVGAQRSSDRPSSDSGVNLVSAVNFITNTDFSDVSICMHENTADDICDILPACKTRKMHTSRRDAFKAINDLPWARVSYQTGQIDFLKKDYNKRDTKAQINIRPLDEKVKVGILRTHTNMCPEQFSFYKDECFDGLVLEGTGLGHTPGQEINASIFEALKNLTASGCVVVMTSSTVYGRIDMNVYDKGRDLQKIGVVGNGTDMLPETAFIKLSWLLSNYSKEDAKKLMAKNLRGEISTRTLINSDIALDSKDQSA